MSTAKSPQGGLDIIQASANNFYGPNVTLADLKNFQDRYPLNSRVVKIPNPQGAGELVEQVYRAGTPDGSVPPGLYAEYLKKAIGYLEQARAYAEPGQSEVIDKLIRYYQTGEYSDWIAVGEAWVQNRVTVDFSNGFVEVYRDARGVKGAIQGFVTVTDEKLNQLMTKIADNAQYFENRAPWKDEYKKQGVKPPVAMAVSPNTATFTSSHSALSYLVAFALANDSALLSTFPSLPVLTNLSASSGATKSGLFVFCD